MLFHELAGVVFGKGDMPKQSGEYFAALCAALFFPGCCLAQTNHFVWLGGGNVSPYTNWATAARDINDAIVASAHGAFVWVTNGVYNSGGRRCGSYALTNRVLLDKGVTVRSVNGPSNTFIVGRWHVPGDPANKFGPAAVRCVGFNHTNAVLIGFTLTNGATHHTGGAYDNYDRCGGGAWANIKYISGTNYPQVQTISNCAIAGNAAHDMGGGMYWGILYNCRIIGNSANTGGGLGQYSVAYNCVIAGNSAANGGGGTAASSLYDCQVISNIAVGTGGGGGSAAGSMFNCLFQGNTAVSGAGGGYYYYTAQYRIDNCVFDRNVTLAVSGHGGGCYGGTLHNCLIIGNQATGGGGGAGGGGFCFLYNCTVVGNRAGYSGHGVDGVGAYNTISYYNMGANWYSGSYTNCCMTPIPPGANNITNQPMFDEQGFGYGTNLVAGNYRLQKISPCVNAGMNFSYMGDPADRRSRDLDGIPRVQLGTVDIGAYEFIPAGSVFIIRGSQ